MTDLKKYPQITYISQKLQTCSFLQCHFSGLLRSSTEITGVSFYSIPILKVRARQLGLNPSYPFLFSICQLKRYNPTPWETPFQFLLTEFKNPQ